MTRSASGAFGDIFDIGSFDRVTEFGFDRQTALIVGVAPAVVANGADIDKADLGLVLGKGRRGEARGPKRGGTRRGWF